MTRPLPFFKGVPAWPSCSYYADEKPSYLQEKPGLYFPESIICSQKFGKKALGVTNDRRSLHSTFLRLLFSVA